MLPSLAFAPSLVTLTSFVRRLFRFFELGHGHFRGPCLPMAMG